MTPNLQPSSRADRKYLWVRFIHPLLRQSVRVDLGTDQSEAKNICDDLSHILGKPYLWQDPGDPQLDGLQPQAISGFFDPMERASQDMDAEIVGCRHRIAELMLEFALFYLQNLIYYDPHFKNEAIMDAIIESLIAKKRMASRLAPDRHDASSASAATHRHSRRRGAGTSFAGS